MMIRIVCCFLFHISSFQDVASSFRRLKFLAHNPHRFQSNYLLPAFLVTIFQFTSVFSLELMNICFLTRNENLIDIIMNYVTFLGISEFDNLYTNSIRNMKAKVLLEKDEDLNELLEYCKEKDK